MTRPARRAISESLAEDVGAAAVDFITGPPPTLIHTDSAHWSRDI
jgi:hypothetical protein